ncbi:MAG: sodium:solute symporter [Acidimicrobiia bacterium]|nr:sodium:solute symporter [Acidimicrobiia bacterium]
MRPLDWWVLAASLVFIISYGLYRSRDTGSVNKYLLAGKTMPWYAMALSIMATQASAITFISTSGQAYVDGMRFVQFYFGLPLAMIIISATAVPLFHRSNVYTAYEYLEQRFDAKTRVLVGIIFLIQRGIAVGVALYAPALVLTVMLGWPDQYTTVIMGTLVAAYTTFGGIKAVTWTDFQQMLVMFFGLFLALGMAIYLLPSDVGLGGALQLAGAAGRLNAVVTSFDWNDRYNLFNGLLGGMFLALSYFGCDQSQVQRYLTGRSIAQSRLSLLFNAVAKIPMQFFILAIGAIVFVFYTFEKPPLVFHQVELSNISRESEYPALAARYDNAFDGRRQAARQYLNAPGEETLAAYRQAQKNFEGVRKDGVALIEKKSGAGFNDTNYIFLSFVMKYLPAGLVGLILAAIFAAAMSTISAEINSLATVTVIDIYQRHIRKGATDSHYLLASRLATVFWGIYAIVTAGFGRSLGSLIEAVNMLGSLFYGGLLGVFVLAFGFRRVGGTAAFIGVLAGEAAIFYARFFTEISFLWYNVIGCVVVVAVGLALSLPRLHARA